LRELTKGGPSKSAGGYRKLTDLEEVPCESGNDSTSLGTGVPAKQLTSQQVYPGLRKAAPTYVALAS
jgi:hypothetical protein